MTMTPPETSSARSRRSADDIRAWIVAELSRSSNVDPATIDAAAHLDTLGVDSFTAIGMTGTLAAWLQRDLPATLMWDYGSIDELAEGLAASENEVGSFAPKGIITLQPHGDRLPLFCFPGVGGHPAIFSALASQLRPHHPCYGLVVPGLNGDPTPLTRVQDIAAVMVESIRLVQSSGPYQLAGYSFGGFLAYETAQQLAAAGETVSMLAIYDAFTSTGRIFRPRWERLIIHAWLLATRPGHLRHLYNRLRRFHHRKRAAANAKPAASSASSLERHGEAVWLADNQAAANYQPRRYSGSIVLFRPTERSVDSPFYRMDESNGWGALASGGVRVVNVRGTHTTMLYADHAPMAAAGLRPYLSDRLCR
jgi:thioesterase domain-containing protein/acyl carrier protein